MQCWFVGEVYAYFEHTYKNERRFLAVINVMKDHRFGNYHIPQVTEDRLRKHFTVINVENILECVGLFQVYDNCYRYNVAWPYMDYGDKVGGRRPGQLSDLL